MVWEHSMSPFLLRLWGDFGIRWYSVAYLLGLLAGYIWFKYCVKKKLLPLTIPQVHDLMFYMALGVILGGRIGYILFYSINDFLHNPLILIRFWEGGMSFHGGCAGVMVAAFLYSRSVKLDFLTLAGLSAVITPVGLFFGRMANFINGELWGKPTNGSWGIIFPDSGDYLPRHPTQLYEALSEGLILFIVLFILFKKGVKPAVLGIVFGFGYSLFRFLIEFVREPDEGIGYVLAGVITTGQILSGGLVLFSLFLLYLTVHKNKIMPKDKSDKGKK